MPIELSTDLPDSHDSRSHGTPTFRPRLSIRRWWAIVSVIFVTTVAVFVWTEHPALEVIVFGVVLITAATLIAKLLEADHRRSAQSEDDLRRSLDQWKDRWHSLHGQSRQNALVLQYMSDGLIMLDEDWTVLRCNPMAKRLLGLRAEEEYLGRDLREIARLPALVDAVRDVRRSGQPVRLAVEITTGSTRVRPLSISVVTIDHRPGGSLLLTLHDETESKNLESVRREFIANVSHEIKTPLAAIKGYAETVELAIEDDPGAAAHFVSQIRNQCLRMERLIADMMQLARAQAGKEKLNFSSVPLSDVVAEAIKTYQPVARAKNITLKRGEFDEQIKVMVDREAVLTIANNLIGNAIRYTPLDGTVEVSVQAVGQFGRLAVVDDGVGIAASELDRIFERFYRADRTRESTSGTGLGLSIVRHLAGALGGEVSVTSEPGQGSTFTVDLPKCDPVGSVTQQEMHTQQAARPR